MTEIINNKQEQGRSMVEMLGVLAVVGVLSVGGIAGYTYAMNKHYENELLAGASERAVLVSAQIVAGQEPSIKEFNNTVAGGTFREAFSADGGLGISVSDVKGAVCKNLIKTVEGMGITLAKDDGETLTDMSVEDCDPDNLNDFVFVFETGMDGTSDGGTSDGDTNESVCDPACENGQSCIQGVCVFSITNCPIEECYKDEETGEEYCYLAYICEDLCPEECDENTGECSRNCKTSEDLAKCPVEECWDDDEGNEYCEVASYCNAFCSENDDGEYECRDILSSQCTYNSDCKDWCQDKDGDCFCLIPGDMGGVYPGVCALVDDYSSDASEGSRMTWFSANNWCQAQGGQIYSRTTDISDNGQIEDEEDIRDDICCQIGDCGLHGARAVFTLNGQPARVECMPYLGASIRFTSGDNEYTPLCD